MELNAAANVGRAKISEVHFLIYDWKWKIAEFQLTYILWFIYEIEFTNFGAPRPRAVFGEANIVDHY